MKKIQILISFLSFLLFMQCQERADKNDLYVPPKPLEVSHPNDKYLYQNNGKSLFEKYGTSIRWRWQDAFKADANHNATPVSENLIIPAAKLLENLWVQPYTYSGPNGEKIIDELLPLEVSLVGSQSFTKDGKKKQSGHALGSHKIVLFGFNVIFTNRFTEISLKDTRVLLKTSHHELAHTAEKRYGPPPGYENVSPEYRKVKTEKEAIKLGMVTDYATSNAQEDFAEMVAHYITLPASTFRAKYLRVRDCSRQTSSFEAWKDCADLNEGRKLIKEKITLVKQHYLSRVGIDLDIVRDTVQQRLVRLVKNRSLFDR